MRVFYSSTFEEFLYTSQTGYAHKASGTELNSLIETVITSLALCTLQLTLFCYFRPIFKHLYQPRCFCVPVEERMQPLPNGFFSWIIPTMNYSTSNYFALGLDAYFFIRFISVTLFFFAVVGTLNMIILIPINYTGGTDSFSASGLDVLSLSNIASTKIQRLNAHFIMSIVTIGCFHLLIIHELKCSSNIRQTFLLSPAHCGLIISKTLLISKVPLYMKDDDVLSELFKVVPGGIKNIWYVYDFSTIDSNVSRSIDALHILEQSQTRYLIRYMREKVPRQPWFSLSDDEDKLDIMMETYREEAEYEVGLEPKFYSPIYIPPWKIPKLDRTIKLKLPGWLRIFALEAKVVMVDWAIDTINHNHEAIDKEKTKLNDNMLQKHDKLFIEFRNQAGASIALQCLLSQIQGRLDLRLIEIHPGDILWNNLSRNNALVCLLEKYLVTLIFLAVIIIYVVPVSFIGLISQIPLLISLFPFLNWMQNFPEQVRRTISSILPSILLSILTELIMVLFRFLTYFKGKMTGSEVDIDLQKWYFSFLFFQQFLVVTILSSVTVIFKQILDQPTSIPVLLAMNLPKAATFFFQFLTIKAFAFCGNNFLRIDQLIKHLTVNHFRDETPRQRFNRLISLPSIRWGTVYPVYSVYACIGLVYCVISPLISIFIIFILSLALLYYKYSLKFIYSHVNESETNGRLYPMALLHLYTGIYCLESCLIGIFFLLKNLDGQRVMKAQGWIMVVILFATIFIHIILFSKYVKHFEYSPILSDKQYQDPAVVEQLKLRLHNDQVQEDETLDEHGNEFYLNKKLLYLHPTFKYEFPQLWLPADPLGVSDQQIKRIQERVPSLQGGGTRGAVINFKSSYRRMKIGISDAPPGYK